MLKVQDLNVYYGGIQALWKISISVEAKEIVAIIGANGAGKSTLLNAVSGVIQPTSGKVEFEGHDITRLETFEIIERGICQVPEAGRVFPLMTVLENLEIGSYQKNARALRARNLEMVYDYFPRLAERTNQIAKTLSGGERQMLAIGRGLMSNPKLMLLDEISLGLSPIVINELYGALREIRSRGITAVIVEQNMRRSLKESDRAYILEAGRIVLHGDAQHLAQDDKVKNAYFGE